MKRNLKSIALFCALISACLMIAACGSKTSDENKKLPDNKAVSTVNSTETSSTVVSQSQEQASSADTGSEESVQAPESSADVSETEEKSEVRQQTQQSGENPENSTENKKETSDEEKSRTSENSKAAEVSKDVSDEQSENDVPDIYNGYYFDDEQIVKDYHTADEFTADEKYNALFKDNKIDKEMTDELKNAENETDMRNIAIKYSEIWKNESEKVYNKLSDMLEEKPEEKEKLISSQAEWTEGLEAAEASFQSEAEEKGLNGTQLFLSVDSAMLNYYRGRTAVLYYQIYLLSGSFGIE
ncbi:MAG: hypothetical protein II059_04015 [Clostridia bacterium]|nr:hypothetical protein [Clostridia bacterium]